MNRPTGSDDFSNSNRLTIAAYQDNWEKYVADTPKEIEPVKDWLKLAVDGLDPSAKIFEFGGGTGRDALYLQSLGYSLESSDAAPAFVELMRQQGINALEFDVLVDELPAGCQLIFADGVMHHFQPAEMRLVVAKVAAALGLGGRFAFTTKEGEGQEWYSEKLGQPRYACYWREPELRSLLAEFGFGRVEVLEDTSYKGRDWLSLVAHKTGPVPKGK